MTALYMQRVTIMFNCHMDEIVDNLKRNQDVNRKYQIFTLSLNQYLVKDRPYYNNTSLDITHVNILQKTDILILQIINKDRGFLNNSEVIKLCKDDCNIIKIPHYRCSIYEHTFIDGCREKHNIIKSWKLHEKINDIGNVADTKKIIEEEINKVNIYSSDELLENMESKLNEFRDIDALSDVSMLDFFINNYRNMKLFQGRGYPSSMFFHELSNKIIMTKLGCQINNEFIDTHFAENTSSPIPQYWYKFCEFRFDNNLYGIGHIQISDIEWYYIMLLSNKTNIVSTVELLELLSKIRK